MYFIVLPYWHYINPWNCILWLHNFNNLWLARNVIFGPNNGVSKIRRPSRRHTLHRQSFLGLLSGLFSHTGAVCSITLNKEHPGAHASWLAGKVVVVVSVFCGSNNSRISNFQSSNFYNSRLWNSICRSNTVYWVWVCTLQEVHSHLTIESSQPLGHSIRSWLLPSISHWNIN